MPKLSTTCGWGATVSPSILGNAAARSFNAVSESDSSSSGRSAATLIAPDCKQGSAGSVEHQEKIDELIRSQADNWRLERMPPVDRNILRLAIYEMLFEKETPKLVVLDEAIELAKKFGSEQSGRFVNGLLDGLLKQHTFPGSLT